MKAMYFIVFFLLFVTAATVFNHYHIHGAFSALYVTVIFFLVLNLLITYWELILWYKADAIKEKSDHFYINCKHDKSIPMSNFMNSTVTCKRFFFTDILGWSLGRILHVRPFIRKPQVIRVFCRRR